MNGNGRSRGRPEGKDYGVVKSLRLTEGDAELLRALALDWGCSEAAAIRRLLREEMVRVRQAQEGNRPLVAREGDPAQ